MTVDDALISAMPVQVVALSNSVALVNGDCDTMKVCELLTEVGRPLPRLSTLSNGSTQRIGWNTYHWSGTHWDILIDARTWNDLVETTLHAMKPHGS